MKDLVIGIDIGGGHILSAAIDINKSVIVESSRSYQKVDSQSSKEDILGSWAKAINRSIQSVNSNDVVGLSFAIPGAFDYRNGIAFYKGNKKYEALYGVSIKPALSPLLKIDHALEFKYLNDASSFGMAEAWMGQAKGSTRSLSITLGTGFGSTFIDEGLPIVEREDVPREGCLWHLPFRKGIVDDYFSTRWFENEYKRRFGKELRGVKEIANEARHGADVKIIFEEFGSSLGDMLEPWLSKFHVEVVVIGGNISGAFDLFETSLKASTQKHQLKTEFKVSSLQEDAALLGSSLMFNPEISKKVEKTLPAL